VRLDSADGAFVELRLLQYEFPARRPARQSGGDEDWDANWLVVRGDVGLGNGRQWTFTAPCLTTWEARSFSGWLRAVVDGKVAPVAATVDDEALEAFVEPVLALSLAALRDDKAAVRVHLSIEALPDWARDSDLYEFFVELSLPLSVLRGAADDWDDDLARFPVR